MVAAYLIGLYLGFSLQAGSMALEKPTLPYYDVGACPFDCCSYGTWSAKSETALRADHDDSSPVVSSVKPGEDVQGLAGVAITKKAGEVRIIRDTTFAVENSLEEITLRPGDMVYALHYVGEGLDKFFFEGLFLIGRTNIKRAGKSESWEVINLPEWTWWAKIRRQNGDTGWSRELDHFDHVDACE